MIAERIVPVHGGRRGSEAQDLRVRKGWERLRLPALFWLVLRHPRDALGATVGFGALVAIIANGLFMQPGPHPAPIFAIRPPPVLAREETGAVAQLPRPRPIPAQRPDATSRIDAVPLPRPRAAPTGAHPDPIADLLDPGRQLSAVQRLLNEFGYGPVKITGTLDDETRASIERFERDHHLAVTGQNTARMRRALSLATGRSLE